MSYEQRFKKIADGCGMGVYGLAELEGRSADKRIKELEDALRPFSNFACSPNGECACNNCKARDLLK